MERVSRSYIMFDPRKTQPVAPDRCHWPDRSKRRLLRQGAEFVGFALLTLFFLGLALWGSAAL